jgi:hypothetical protein
MKDIAHGREQTAQTLLTPLVQQQFQRFLLDQCDHAEMASHVAVRPGLPIQERLAIYHNAYRWRLRDALSDTFEQTHNYLGDKFFDEAVGDYITASPSTTRNLRWYGATLPAFLAQATVLADYPEAAELAAFEWALGLAFDADDQSVLTLADLAHIAPESWDSIGFDCHASVNFLLVHSNCDAIWMALKADEDPPEATWNPQPQAWLVWRKDQTSYFRLISHDEYLALAALQRGHSFAQVCNDAAPEADELIGTWLQTWIADGVLHQFCSPDADTDVDASGGFERLPG